MSQYSRLNEIIVEHSKLALEYSQLLKNFDTEEEALEAQKRKVEIKKQIELLRAERYLILGK